MGIGLITTVTSIKRHTHVLLYLECWEIWYTLWPLSCPRVSISLLVHCIQIDSIISLLIKYQYQLVAIGFWAISTMMVGRFITGMAGAGRTLSYTYVSSVVPQGKRMILYIIHMSFLQLILHDICLAMLKQTKKTWSLYLPFYHWLKRRWDQWQIY